MLLYEVIVNEVQGNGVPVVFDLFKEANGQAGEPAHMHPHG